MAQHTYSDHVEQRIRQAPDGLGRKLGRIALKRGYTVLWLSAQLGAARVTVYRWLAGHPVSNAYRGVVEDFIAQHR